MPDERGHVGSELCESGDNLLPIRVESQPRSDELRVSRQSGRTREDARGLRRATSGAVEDEYRGRSLFDDLAREKLEFVAAFVGERSYVLD